MATKQPANKQKTAQSPHFHLAIFEIAPWWIIIPSMIAGILLLIGISIGGGELFKYLANKPGILNFLYSH